MREVNPFPFQIACNSKDELANRVTWMPVEVVTDVDRLRAGGYQEEGAIVPDARKRRLLTRQELGAIAVDIDTPDAMRLVRVPKHIEDLAVALRRNGPTHETERGTVILSGASDLQLSVARPGRVSTTVNRATNEYVGLHIDAKSAPNPAQGFGATMMGIAASSGGRGFCIVPSVTMECVPPELWVVGDDPEQRLERRHAIRSHVQDRIRRGEAVGCYMLALRGSPPEVAATYEAYANAQPRWYPHDGTTMHNARVESTAMLFYTPYPIGPDTFPSIV